MSRKNDFSKLGFDEYESIDLSIMMNLKTAEDIREWMAAVGDEDVRYGIDLMTRACEMQRLKDIDDAVQTNEDCIDAKVQLSLIFQ